MSKKKLKKRVVKPVSRDDVIKEGDLIPFLEFEFKGKRVRAEKVAIEDLKPKVDEVVFAFPGQFVSHTKPENTHLFSEVTYIRVPGLGGREFNLTEMPYEIFKIIPLE